MKYTDYEKYNEINGRMDDLKGYVVDNTNNSLIVDEDNFVETYDQAVKYGEDNRVDITDGVLDMNGNNVDFDTEMRELEEEKADLEFDLKKVFKIINEIKQVVTVSSVEASHRSISTYLAIPMDQYEKFMEAFDGVADIDNYTRGENEKQFGVRISDHESGSHYVEALDRSFNYDSDYINIDINRY